MRLLDRFRRPSRAGFPDRLGESGQVLVLVVLGILVLFGAVALGVDGSRAFEERRNAQAAVDHAATSAAHASCNASTVAQARAAGFAAALRNGYDDAAPAIVVQVEQVVVSGTPVPYTFRAVIDSTIPGTFAKIVGFADFDITVEATGGATGCGATTGGPLAMYGGGDNCVGGSKYAVDVSGSTHEVYGGVHSNSDANVGGANNDFTETTSPDIADPFTYVGVLKAGSIGNGNSYAPGYPLDVGPATKGWPSGWGPTDIGSGGTPPPAGSLLRAYYDLAVANGTLFSGKVENITKDGVWYTTGSEGFEVSNISGASRNVVLVAPNGWVKISVSSKTLNAITDAQIDALPGMGSGANLALNLPRPDLLMLAGKVNPDPLKQCEDYGIAASGSSFNYKGILWAPRGLIEMDGSSNVVNGCLVGWAVALKGSNIDIRCAGSGSPALPTILLLQ